MSNTTIGEHNAATREHNADHEELYKLEQWIAFQLEEAQKRHGATSTTWVNVSARLIALLALMHTVLDKPEELLNAIELWRSKRALIQDRANDDQQLLSQ